MQICENNAKALENKIEEIIEILNELKNNQQKELQLLQNNHTINMKKLNKLQEYNKILDMTNQFFEIRISGIEAALKELNKNLSA